MIVDEMIAGEVKVTRSSGEGTRRDRRSRFLRGTVTRIVVHLADRSLLQYFILQALDTALHIFGYVSEYAGPIILFSQLCDCFCNL